MNRRLALIVSNAWGAALVLLTAQVAATSILRYLTGEEAPPPPIIANGFAYPFLVIHVIAGIIALVVGPVQFVRVVRSRRPALHRASGLVYVAACAVAAPAGFILALGTTAGPIAGVGFAIPAVLLPLFTYYGVKAAVERRFADHREWMLRSYALVSIAITLRLMLPASGLLGLEFLPAYQVIAWLCWINNLVLVEYYIRRSRRSATIYPTLAAA